MGFGFAGWITGATAQKMVAQAAETSRNELAAAICVEEFMHAADAKTRLRTLNEASWFQRSEMLTKGGWATMPDRKEPDSAVAGMCASLLADKKT